LAPFKVRDDRKRLLRPGVLGGVGLDNRDSREASEACAKPSRKRRIALDHDDHRSCSDERLGEDACSSPDLDDEVAARDLCVGDKVACELLTSEEVLAGRFPCGSPPDGHGT